VTKAQETGVPSLPEAVAGESSPWVSWITSPEGGAVSTQSVLDWLERLDAELPQHAAACQDDELRLAALWRHMVPKLTEFLPDEVGHVVSAQLEAAARRGAADALVEMVRVERHRLAAADHALAEPEAAVDSETLRRLLDGIATDRASTGRAAIAEALETLCSIALELELTERRLGSGSPPSETLADLRDHVTKAAATLRGLPNNVQVRTQSDEQLSVAVRRCLSRYSGALEAALEWEDSEAPVGAESAAALLWVLQELLHHLHGGMAGWVQVTVTSAPELTMALATPSTSLATSGREPDWMLRCRLRLQLAGGEIREVPADNGSRVLVTLPQ
jgi:hypothetical protein